MIYLLERVFAFVSVCVYVWLCVSLSLCVLFHECVLHRCVCVCVCVCVYMCGCACLGSVAAGVHIALLKRCLSSALCTFTVLQCPSCR